MLRLVKIKEGMKVNTYIIFDGRAIYSIDDAMVIECFEAKNNKKAERYFKREYSGFDYVLTDENCNFLYSEILKGQYNG